MAILRLSNGSDVLVKLGVSEAIAALKIEAGSDGFVELPAEGGPIHVRPQGVIAVVEDSEKTMTGFLYRATDPK